MLPIGEGEKALIENEPSSVRDHDISRTNFGWCTVEKRHVTTSYAGRNDRMLRPFSADVDGFLRNLRRVPKPGNQTPS